MVEKKEVKRNFLQKLLEIYPEEKKKEKEEEKKFELPKSASGPFNLIIDSPTSGVERYYFWIIRFLENRKPYGLGYRDKDGEIIKLKDLYSAAETSSYWGNVEARKGVQQEKFSQFMATVGRMTKDLFQVVRELRVIDERLEYYNGYDKGDFDAANALKSVWTDLVEGGMKNPGSVFGLSSQVGFVTLPDLFFKAYPKKAEEVEKEANKFKNMGINVKVLEVLGRKLKQFLIWKEKTQREITQRRRFVKAYLRQHFQVIKLYLNWLKPYLRNIRKLQMEGKEGNIDMVTAFETSKIELEVMAIKKRYDVKIYGDVNEEREYKEKFPCVIVKFDYTAIPQMVYQQEGSRGAIHAGRTKITITGYSLSKDEIEKYKKKIDDEDLEILTSMDQALEAFKDDIEKYLHEEDEDYKKKKEEVVYESEGFFSPFTAIFKGFKDVLTFEEVKEKKEGEKTEEKLSPRKKEEEKNAAKKMAGDAKTLYTVFKKSHGMLTT